MKSTKLVIGGNANVATVERHKIEGTDTRRS